MRAAGLPDENGAIRRPGGQRLTEFEKQVRPPQFDHRIVRSPRGGFLEKHPGLFEIAFVLPYPREQIRPSARRRLVESQLFIEGRTLGELIIRVQEDGQSSSGRG
jgi:hypothetical protein